MKAIFTAVLLTTAALACELEAESPSPLTTFIGQLLELSTQDPCLEKCCETLKSSRSAQRYTYYQNTGHFVGGSGNWAINTYAYSGQGDGYMNPAK